MLTPRPRPCPSCPYRRDVPSGIWSAGEYDKLTGYDGEAADQAAAGATGVFMCHQGTEHLCAGWVGHKSEPHDLLALRLSVSRGESSPEALRYATDVPLFASGAEAAAHGQRDLARPNWAARTAIAKITRARQARGNPVEYE